MAPVKYDLIRLQGGLDLVTPTLSLKPGVLREATNFEVSPFGGYARISGYERVDGRPSPTGASYAIFTVTLTATISVGDTITGATSGSTAVVIATPDAATLVVTKASASFTTSEALKVGGVSKGTLTAVGSAISLDAKTSAQYQQLAANCYRNDIGAVPGSGPIRGVAYFNSLVYAWRDNVSATALGFYVSSASGWTAIPLGYEMHFKLGTAAINVGDTVVGATSGASAVVKHICTQSGDWTTSDDAGQIIFSTITGAFVSNEVLKVGGVSKATTATASSAITLAPGGRVMTIISNFGGYSEEAALYGTDGKNRAFEFYATGVYVPIDTGNTVDTPTLIAAHKNHLFLTFGSSMQHSAPGDPHSWQAILGAGEIACDDLITNMLVQPGSQATGAMAVYTRNGTNILYGTGLASWNFVSYNMGTGGLMYTAQNMNASYVLDDRGVMNLVTTLSYGNFDTTALTFNIQPWIQQRRNLATDSCVNRERAQYRVFFSDGSGLYLTLLNGNMMGSMPVQFPNPVLCITEGERTDGTETSYFGSSNGYVYALDVGTSFDGQSIAANILLTYNSENSARILKRYRKGSMEIYGNGYAEFDFSYSLGYADTNISQASNTTYVTSLNQSYWDAASWDAFVWDGKTLEPSEVEIVGTAENIAVRVSSVSDYFAPFTINSVILHFTPRRGLR